MIQQDARVCKHCRRDVPIYRPFAPAEEKGAFERELDVLDHQTPDTGRGDPAEVSKEMIIFAAVIVVAGIIFTFFTWNESDGRSVKYEVRGSAVSASLTYQNQSGGTDQKTANLPWTLVFKGQRGAFVYISAQNQRDYGRLYVAIYVDSQLMQQAESNSPYGIASASGQLP